ncbi:ARL14 effector protein [Trichonephila inaurata madagascariensis]|uniref:ARL14 effector protein n=2 Tax=Trichonephila inaurata madagascariensis TaxID=2747483 RepID=A0A8X6YVZ5_9ARAC|nr:ARL14 effector protein [Trichonephila inaurata madagascariensis]
MIIKLKPLFFRPKKEKNPPKYDAMGIHIKSGLDLCDCLDVECPGCYTPCPACTSAKCGSECRRNRHWEYQGYLTEGGDVLKNPIKDWTKKEEEEFDEFFKNR